VPTYQYQCEKCSYEFEKFQSMTALVLRKCPKCGKSSLKRLIGTGAGIIFKGSGFYQTDYRSDSYKQAVKKETGSGSKKEGEKDSKPETKKTPSAKTDKKTA
jgi:putative FmdB family regulatory protein